MSTPNFPQRHPLTFSLLLLLLLIVVQAVGVGAAGQMGLPPTTFALYTQILLAVILLILVTTLRWWREIGFRRAYGWAALLIYLPALVLPLGNLTFGIAARSWPAYAGALALGLLSGFVEETIFRGLMLRAFRPRGPWRAVLITTALFGVTHIFNVLAGYEPLYAAIQVAYGLAIGFGFGAMVLKGRLLWPLILAHGLGNFIAFINAGEIGLQLYIVSLVYILLFTGYGLYLMLRVPEPVNDAEAWQAG